MPASTTPPNPPATQIPKQRGCLGLGLKSALGCGAFVLGVAVTLVLLLPTLLSGFVARRGEQAFAELHHGRLEIGSASLAWFGRQELDGLRLLDPDGAEVARARVELPGLRDLLGAASGRVGLVTLTVAADLVADDAGVMNLERALAARATRAAPGSGDRDGAGSDFDLAGFLRRLDLDVRVDLERVAWSDATTRRAGRPFEISRGELRLTAAPGRPLVARGEARIAGDVPGRLEFDAAVHGPVDLAARWPLGRATARARIEGFSSAMVDALAGLSGDLVATVGPSFGLALDLAAESAERATLDLALDGTRAGVGLHARLADGELSALEKPLLVATLPFPRTILERVLGPHLPPDARLELADAGAPWTLRVARLRMPLPDPAARDLAALRPALERAEIDVDLDLPGSWRLETDALRAARLAPSASGLRLTARAAPAQPLTARFTAALEAGTPGRVRVDLSAPGAFAVLAGAPPPPVDLDAHVEGLSTLAIGELAGQGERLLAALGPLLALEIEGRGVNLAGGSLRLRAVADQLAAEVSARVVNGALSIEPARPARVSWTPARAFVAAEIAPHLPPEADLALDGPLALDIEALSVPIQDPATGGLASTESILAGLAARLHVAWPTARWSSPQTRAAETPVELRGAALDVEVTAGGAPRARFAAEISLGEPARVAVELRAKAGLAELALAGARAMAADLKLSGLPSAALERLAAQPGRIAPTLGPRLDLALSAEADWPRTAAIELHLGGEAGRVDCVAQVADGKVRTAAGRGLELRLAVTPELLAELVRDSLPAGARLELAGDGPQALVATLVGLVTPLEAADLAARLASTSLALDVELPAVRYADANTDAAGRPAVLEAARLTVRLAPEEPPRLRCAARIVGTPPGEIALDVTALDPLLDLGGPEGWKRFRVTVDARASEVPTALVDALAAQHGLLVEALGPRLAAGLEAPEVSFARGAFEARFEGGENRVTLGGRLEEGTLVVERADGLDARVSLGPIVMDRVVGSLLPLFKQASFALAVDRRDLTGAAALAPFVVQSDDLRFAVGSDVSKLSGTLRVDLGTLSFRGLPLLADFGLDLGAADVRLPAFAVPIVDGVATYRKLPIKIAGRELLFDGTVRLTDGEMSLGTAVPLALLGRKFDKELARLRGLVPADTTIPLEIRGKWNAPRVSFQEGFLKGLLEKAAGKAAQDGLGGLLDDLLGGKKKKDG
ncbi:MAG: hypothetical protein JNK02_00930 [Planctomycetes bacterium]|nr:hypothetical protein [Planctomycetota bacterium]